MPLLFVFAATPHGVASAVVVVIDRGRNFQGGSGAQSWFRYCTMSGEVQSVAPMNLRTILPLRSIT